MFSRDVSAMNCQTTSVCISMRENEMQEDASPPYRDFFGDLATAYVFEELVHITQTRRLLKPEAQGELEDNPRMSQPDNV